MGQQNPDYPETCEKILQILKKYDRPKKVEKKMPLSREKIIDVIEKLVEVQRDLPNYIVCEKLSTTNFENVLIVGDIHGNLTSLLRIIQPFLQQKVEGMIFLGDYVDRGDQSLVCFLIVATLVIMHPDRVIALRGNHEDVEMNYRYGFMDQLEELFSKEENFDELVMEFERAYNFFSLAALTPRGSICVHGGIAKEMRSFEELNDIPKPHYNCIRGMAKNKDRVLKNVNLLEEIRWNDPEEQMTKFKSSFRGPDYYTFNKRALKKVLSNSKATRLIRAHQSNRGGFQELFNGQLLHVFSSEPYFGMVPQAYTLHETELNGESKTFVRDLDFNIFVQL